MRHRVQVRMYMVKMKYRVHSYTRGSACMTLTAVNYVSHTCMRHSHPE